MPEQTHSPARRQLNPPALMLLDGLYLITRKGLKRYVAIPLTINIILFVFLFYWGMQQLSSLQITIESYLPSWLSFLSWILWPIYFITFWLFLTFLFVSIANIVAAPFNAFLSEKVEAYQGYPSNEDSGLKAFFLMVPKTLAREIRKFISNLKWLVLLAILFFIPGLNILSILIGGWLMAIQYLDCPADNQNIPFRECLARLGHNKLPAFMFGLSVMLVSMIPIINFLIIPAAIAAATCLWHERYQPQGQGNKL